MLLPASPLEGWGSGGGFHLKSPGALKYKIKIVIYFNMTNIHLTCLNFREISFIWSMCLQVLNMRVFGYLGYFGYVTALELSHFLCQFWIYLHAYQRNCHYYCYWHKEVNNLSVRYRTANEAAAIYGVFKEKPGLQISVITIFPQSRGYPLFTSSWNCSAAPLIFLICRDNFKMGTSADPWLFPYQSWFLSSSVPSDECVLLPAGHCTFVNDKRQKEDRCALENQRKAVVQCSVLYSSALCSMKYVLIMFRLVNI